MKEKLYVMNIRNIYLIFNRQEYLKNLKELLTLFKTYLTVAMKNSKRTA